jgi:hypothetical protein
MADQIARFAGLLAPVLGGLIAGLLALVVQRRAPGYWAAQERWRFKADVYSRLLQNLAEQERLTSWFAYDQPIPEAMQKHPYLAEVEKRYGERLQDLWSDGVRVRSVARIWLGADAAQALDALERDEQKNARQGGFVPQTQSLEAAVRAVTAAAERDLQL